jgi:hypothetical protein
MYWAISCLTEAEQPYARLGLRPSKAKIISFSFKKLNSKSNGPVYTAPLPSKYRSFIKNTARA